MRFAEIPYPNIDPVLFSVGPFAVRWYALAYIIGLLFAWWYARRLAGANPASKITKEGIDDLFLWSSIGVIVGGRLGFMLFYDLSTFLSNPLSIVYQPGQGIGLQGMSFHGGFLGVVVSVILFAMLRKLNLRELGDIVAASAPVGILLGRLANFINGELYGRPTDVPWAMRFPIGPTPGIPVHPSQLYEAILEGLVLFIVLAVVIRMKAQRALAGTVMGLFMIGYGSARFFVEFYRTPDSYLFDNGYLFGWLTMGQILSTPMILLGFAFLVWARKAEQIKVTGYNA